MAQAVLYETLVTNRVATRPRSVRASRGFTLVELGAVVVIVSVLAMLAIVGYRKMITSSHSAEATHMVNAIRVAQEAYKAETGTYANISPSIAVTGTGGNTCSNSGSMYPTTSPGAFKTGWGAACGSACNSGIDWTAIPLHVDGPVMYGYSTIAGFAGTGTGPSSISTMIGRSGTYSVTFPANPVTDWYVASACGDPDGDGTHSAYVGSSFTNEIFESNEGN